MNYKSVIFISILIFSNLIMGQYLFQKPEMFSVILGTSDYYIESPSLSYMISLLTVMIDTFFVIFLSLLGILELTKINKKSV
jgi:hypothetical protein